MNLTPPFRNNKPIFSYHTLRRYLAASLEHQYQPLGQSIDFVGPMPSDPCFAPIYALLSFCRSLESLKRIHAQFVVHGVVKNLLLETKLVSMYGSYGCIEQARLVFDQIHGPDLYSWKVMLRWYFLNDLYEEIIEFYRFMRKCLREHDNIVWSIVLKACSELQRIDEGMKVHCRIVKVGNPDGFVMTGLIDMYGKCGMVDSSRRVFNDVSEKSVVSWTSMLSSYVQNDCADEGLLLYNQMVHNCNEPNEFTLGSLLTACLTLCALHQGKWVHSCIIKKGLSQNSFVATTLLNMYVKCGTVSDAYSILDELASVDLISWTAMIVGFTQRNHPDEALKLFINKKWPDVIPNSVTLASVLSACSQLKYLNFGCAVHLLAIKLGCDEDVSVRNALIDMYAKCGLINDAAFIFDCSPEKDVITWNSMLGGYAENGLFHECLSLFRKMRSNTSSLDTVTMVSVMSACAGLGTLAIGSSFHAYATKFGFLSNVYVGTTLLSLYAKCGDADSARRVFDGIQEKNMVTWSAMVGGYGMQGNSNGCLELFTEMLQENFLPNDVIFTSILFACSHTGMIHEGLKHFGGMSEEYHLIPSIKHYVCIVDLLARAGRLEDALSFIDKMPLKPNINIWGALLHGCRLHSRLDIGEIVTKRMLELCPDSAEYYVLISNFYSSDGRWEQASEVRDLVKIRELHKSPGYSFVEMEDVSCSSLKVVGI